jgi:hypothetical protein
MYAPQFLGRQRYIKKTYDDIFLSFLYIFSSFRQALRILQLLYHHTDVTEHFDNFVSSATKQPTAASIDR